MRSLVIASILFLLFAGLASAGTVVLTGACSVPNQNSNSLLFSLINSGNDTATNVSIMPSINGAAPLNASYKVNALPPRSNVTIPIGVSNIIEGGAHAARIVTAYQQGPSYFTAVFPCLLYFANVTASQVTLIPYSSAIQGGRAAVTVDVVNTGSGNVYANVSLALPPSLNYTTASHYLLNLTPHESANVTFGISVLPLPQGGTYSSYGVAAFASYSAGNLSYATMEIFSINPPQPTIAAEGSPIFLAAIVAAAAIAALVAFSLFKRRGRRRRRA